MFDESKIGQSFPPFSIEVERGKIRELAQAIGDTNPIYYSRAAARDAGYEDIPIFPTLPTVFTFWGNQHKMEQMTGVGVDLKRVLHGEEAYDYLAPIVPGDILTGVMTLTDVRTTQGKGNASMSIFTFVTHYTNQHGKAVLNDREVVIVRS